MVVKKINTTGSSSVCYFSKILIVGGKNVFQYTSLMNSIVSETMLNYRVTCFYKPNAFFI